MKDKEYETITSKQYHKLKLSLKKLEEHNYNHIYIIPCNGSKGWLELAEHSALFFYYEVCKKLHLNNKFMDDSSSFYNQYEIGYMRTLSSDAIVRSLQRAKLFKSIEREGYFIIITLNKTFTVREVEELKATEEKRRLDNLTVVDAVNLNPRLHQALVKLCTRLHRVCNHRLDALATRTNGAALVALADDTLATYHQITMMKNVDKSKIIEKLTHMRTNIYNLIVQVKVIGDAKLLDLTICASLAESVIVIRDLIEQNLKELANAKKGKEQNGATQNHPSQS